MKQSLKFLREGIVDGVTVFEAGKTYQVDTETGSAARWIRRGIAVSVEDVLELPEVKDNTDKEEITDSEDSELDDLDIFAGEEIEEKPTAKKSTGKKRNYFNKK